MNSSEQLEQETAKKPVLAPPASNWIELIAVPVASAIMEAQPIALLLALIVPHLAATGALIPDTLTLILSMLGLQWWAMWHKARAERHGHKEHVAISLIGIAIALALVAVTHIDEIGDNSFLFITVILTIWFWYRGLYQARDPLSDEYLINAFKAGFLLLLVVLVFALLFMLSGVTDLSNDLLRDLPIFFLAGMVGLSFKRIGVVQREQKRHPGNGSRESMSGWAVALTITWVVLVVVSVALEALPIDVIAAILSPFTLVLRLLTQGILYLFSLLAFGVIYVVSLVVGGIIYILSLFIHVHPDSLEKNQQNANHVARQIQQSSTSPMLVRILIIVFLVIVTLSIWRILQKRKRPQEDNTAEEEEVRETLDRNAILKQRRDERKRRHQKEVMLLEALNPTSARARYRDFLQVMATKGDEMERLKNETPLEYQKRLLALVRKRKLHSADLTETDAAILNELTLAYAQERYGGKPLDTVKQNYLGSRVPKLIQQLIAIHSEARNETPRVVSQWSAQRSRWGED